MLAPNASVYLLNNHFKGTARIFISKLGQINKEFKSKLKQTTWPKQNHMNTSKLTINFSSLSSFYGCFTNKDKEV